MATQYNINKYIQGVNGFGLKPCDKMYSATLGAGTEATVAVPGASPMGGMSATKAQRYVAVFNYEEPGNFWVAINATATVPAGTSLAATNSMLNPRGMCVKYGDTIHVISADASRDISISFFTIDED